MSHMLLCKKPVYVDKQGIYFDCGHCRVCRLKKSGEWSLRIKHEASSFNHKVVMVTLTYNASNLPKHCTLLKRDLQLFIKRLRKALGKRRIKYYFAGEYGPKTMRPHYHGIIFGLDENDKDLVFKCWNKCDRYVYDNGGYKLALDRDFYNYVTGYVNKKLGKHYSDRFRNKYPKRIPEFQTSSNGIGKQYCLKMAKHFKEKGVLYERGKERVIPRYYRKVLGITADTYTETINDYQKKIFNYVCDVYSLTDNCYREVYDNEQRRGLNAYAGHVVDYRFWNALNECREACDARLKGEYRERSKIDECLILTQE